MRLCDLRIHRDFDAPFVLLQKLCRVSKAFGKGPLTFSSKTLKVKAPKIWVQPVTGRDDLERKKGKLGGTFIAVFSEADVKAVNCWIAAR